MSVHLSYTQDSSRLSGYSVLIGTLVGALSGLYVPLFLVSYLAWLLQVPPFDSFVPALSLLPIPSFSLWNGTYLQWLAPLLYSLIIGGMGSLVGALLGYFGRKDLTVVASTTVAIFLVVGYVVVASGSLFFIPQAIFGGIILGIAPGLGGWYSLSETAVSFNRKHHIPIFIILLATGFTLLSLFFVYSQNGHQSAGFPMPVVRDMGGGSPVSGWGRLGPEDIPFFAWLSIPLNVMFYSALLWLAYAWPIQKVIFRERKAEGKS